MENKIEYPEWIIKLVDKLLESKYYEEDNIYVELGYFGRNDRCGDWIFSGIDKDNLIKMIYKYYIGEE